MSISESGQKLKPLQRMDVSALDSTWLVRLIMFKVSELSATVSVCLTICSCQNLSSRVVALVDVLCKEGVPMWVELGNPSPGGPCGRDHVTPCALPLTKLEVIPEEKGVECCCDDGGSTICFLGMASSPERERFVFWLFLSNLCEFCEEEKDADELRVELKPFSFLLWFLCLVFRRIDFLWR